jgi:hypothetical protein
MTSQMLKPSLPMSNTERQRQFRERNPGYYGRLHRKRNAPIKAMLKQQKAAAAARIQAEIKAQLRAEADAAAAQPAPPPALLMLPAPVIDPLTSEIAALAETLGKALVEVPCDGHAHQRCHRS